MKIATAHEPIIQGGILETLDIGISNDPRDQVHILNALSASLYTDKVSAPLREYAANAADANIEAGNPDQPIEVTLPSNMSPHVSIRDFGFGMTEEQIRKVFCQLGNSTKRGSNEQTGAYGIGSKAGFAYGDSFMVTSYIKGTKTVYNAFREDGMPKLAKMHAAKTDSPDGIEVKVPVRLDDIDEFLEKAERVYRYFRIRPIFHGGEIHFEPRDAKLGGAGWRYVGHGRSVAVMGNMGYEIRNESMGGLSLKQAHLLRIGVELDFNIGEIEVALNREGLQYVDKTRKIITDRLAVAVKEIGSIFVKQIASAPNLWMARKLYAATFERTGDSSSRALREVVDGAITWGNEKITSGYHEIGVQSGDKFADKITSVMTAHKKNYGRGTLRIEKETDRVYAGDKTVLVVNDLPTKRFSPSRVKGFFEHNADKADSALVIFTYENDKARVAHWKARKLDGAPFILLSTVPPATTVTTGNGAVKNKKHGAAAFSFKENYTDNRGNEPRSNWWDSVKVDLENGKGVFVWLDKFEVLNTGSSNQRPGTFQSDVKGLRRATILSDKPIHGFKLKYKDKLGKGWVELKDYVAAKVAALHKTKGFDQAYADWSEAGSFTPQFSVTQAGEFPEGSLVRELLETIKSMRAPKFEEKLLQALRGGELRPWLTSVQPTVTPSVDLSEMAEKTWEKFPMLRFIGTVHHRSTKVVADYVALLVEKSN